MRVATSRSLVATLGALALITAACGGSDDSGAASPATTGENVPTDQPAAAVEAAFVPLASGGQLDFNSLRGQDVLLWFWAPW